MSVKDYLIDMKPFYEGLQSVQEEIQKYDKWYYKYNPIYRFFYVLRSERIMHICRTINNIPAFKEHNIHLIWEHKKKKKDSSRASVTFVDNIVNITYGTGIFDIPKKHGWNIIFNCMCSSINHELIHVRQFENNTDPVKETYRANAYRTSVKDTKQYHENDNRFPDEFYLAHHLEVMAYANGMIHDLHMKGLDQRHIFTVLRYPELAGAETLSPVYKNYKNTFGVDHKVMKKFLKYAYMFAQEESLECMSV